MVKSYVSLAYIEDPKRLDRSLDSLLDLGIDGLHLDIMSTTPKGTATPFLPEYVTAIAEYSRRKQRYDGFKVDVHLLVPMQHLAVRNYKRKGISGIILQGDPSIEYPRRFSRSLYDIKHEEPRMKSGVSHSVKKIDVMHAFMKDVDYIIYTAEDGDIGMMALERLCEISHIKVRSNPLLDIMVEGRFAPQDVKSICATGVDAIIMRCEKPDECKYALEVMKSPNSSDRI